MLETMYDAPGIGLAAVQVGAPLRLITIDLSKKTEDEKTRRCSSIPRSSGHRPRPVRPTRKAACRSPNIMPR
jgi:peptide deformylase